MKAPDHPRVAVITPYHGESIDLILQCHRSVISQSHSCLHVLVADGRPRHEIDSWSAHHIILPESHRDIGSTPRLIGSYHAIGLGVEAVTFLDADNWYSENHIQLLMEEYRSSGAEFISSSRTLCRLDGSTMGPCPLINPDRFVDTNCMFFGKEAFHLLHHWVLMPQYGHLIGDRIMLHRIKQSGIKRAHINYATVNYRCGKEGLYRIMNEPIPNGVDARPDYESSFRQWIEDGNPSL